MDKIKNWKKYFDETSRQSNTNCYDNMDYIVETIAKYPLLEFKGGFDILQKFEIECIKNLRNPECLLYRLDIIIKSGKKYLFNHSFGIIQCSTYFIIIDSWEAVHYLRSSSFVDWISFRSWFHSFYNSVIQDALDIHEHFLENPWNKSGLFEKDREKLEESGEWVQDYPKGPKSSSSSSNFIIDINIQIFDLIKDD